MPSINTYQGAEICPPIKLNNGEKRNMKQFKDLLKIDALVLIIGFCMVLLNPEMAYVTMYLVLLSGGILMFQSYYLGLKRKPKNTKANTNVKLKIDTRLTPHRIVNIFIVGAITLLFSMAIMHKTLVFQRVYLSLIASSLMMLLSLYAYNKTNGITLLKKKYRKEYFKFGKYEIGALIVYMLYCFWGVFKNPESAYNITYIMLVFVALFIFEIIFFNVRRYKRKEMKEVTKLLEVKKDAKFANLTEINAITIPKHLSDKAIYQDTDCIITESHIEVNEIPKEHAKVKSKCLKLCVVGLSLAFISGMAISFLYPTKAILEIVAQMLVIVVPSIGGMAYGYGLATMETFGKYVLSMKPNEKVTDERNKNEG